MKPISYGQVRYGDPNAYWGNPACLLEPGDAGYVATPGQNQDSRQSDKHLPSNEYSAPYLTDRG